MLDYRLYSDGCGFSGSPWTRHSPGPTTRLHGPPTHGRSPIHHTTLQHDLSTHITLSHWIRQNLPGEPNWMPKVTPPSSRQSGTSATSLQQNCTYLSRDAAGARIRNRPFNPWPNMSFIPVFICLNETRGPLLEIQAWSSLFRKTVGADKGRVLAKDGGQRIQPPESMVIGAVGIQQRSSIYFRPF